jgi:hypothetical protein
VETKPEFRLIRVEERLPPVGRKVFIMCKRYCCPGHLDKRGVWRSEVGSKELMGVIGWYEEVG